MEQWEDRASQSSHRPLVPLSHQNKDAAVAQLVEHVLGKDEVKGSSPLSSFCGER